MSEPVTIGGQTFINDPNKGWIDRKTKQPADKALVKLLDTLELKPVEEKLKIKVDKSVEPITIGNTKYEYDANQQAWITADSMRWRPPDSMQHVLNAARSKASAGVILDIAPQIEQAMGAVATAGKQKVSVKTKTPLKPRLVNTVAGKSSLAINTQFVKIITHLASINGLIQQRTQQQIEVNRNIQDQLDEAKIENDDQQKEFESQQDARKVSGGGLAGMALGGLLIAGYIDPIVEIVTNITNGIGKVGSFMIDAIKSINGMFGSLLGKKTEVEDELEPNTASTGGQSASQQQATAEQQPHVAASAPPQNAVPATPSTQPAPVASSASSPSRGSSARPSDTTRTGAGTVSAGNGAQSSQTAQTGRSSSTAAPQASPVQQTNTPAPAQAQKVAAPDGSSYAGLKLKSNEAISGGQAAPETIQFAKIVQAQVPQLTKFNAFSDSYHKGFRSKHNQGMAFDFGISDTSQSAVVAEQVKALADANGYRVKIRDEYKNPSGPATGGHIHVTVYGPGNGSSIEGGGFVDTVKQGINQGITGIADIVKGMASIARQNSTAYDVSVTAGLNKGNSYAEGIGKMEKEQAVKRADLVQIANPEPKVEAPPTLPNLNASRPDLGIKNPATSDDKSIVYNYLRYFKVLPAGTTAPSAVLAK